MEWEQLAVGDLATPEGCRHLLDAAHGDGLPPGDVANGGPLALWYLLNRPEFFREVYCRHERGAPDVWCAVRTAAGLPLPNPEAVEGPLAGNLGALFREHTGAGGACAVAAHRIPGAVYLSIRLGDRPAAFETFTPSSGPESCRLVPAATADFVYYPRDGTVLLRSPWRCAERRRELLDCVGLTALKVPLHAARPGFDLEGLKYPFHPLPDADDVQSVRVKTLCLRYPGRSGRRELRLQTLTSDGPSAIDEMVRSHAGRDIDELQVSHAVLQVNLRLEGCLKSHLVRLWPDRCDAGHGPFRTRVLAALRHWGL